MDQITFQPVRRNSRQERQHDVLCQLHQSEWFDRSDFLIVANSARLNSNYNISKYVTVGENLMVAKWFDRGCAAGNDRGIPFLAASQHPGLAVRNSDGSLHESYDRHQV